MKADDVAAKYRVSRAWVHRLVQRRRETGEVTPRRQTKFRARALAEDQEDRLRALVTAQPDRTLAELRAALPTSAGLTTIWRALGRLQLTVKKTVHADEQRRPDVAAARRRWHDTQSLWDMGQYVFLDEYGVTTDLLRRYSRSPRGTWLHDHTPCSHWQTHTVVAALRLDGVTAPAVFDGRSTARRFRPTSTRCWCQRCGPAMWSSSTTSRSTSTRTSARPRNFDQVCELIAAAIGLFTPAECGNYIRHSGYRVATSI